MEWKRLKTSKRKPTKKQKLLADAVTKLDSKFELKVIDCELCLYKLRADGKYDVEISGTSGYKKCCTVYLWQKHEGLCIIKKVDNVSKDPEIIVNLVNELLDNADLPLLHL